ncbi:MAG: GGDEF domain-containing protein [Pseudomonadota bacterium]
MAVLLAATVLGVLASLAATFRMLRPISHIVRAIDVYRTSHRVVRLNRRAPDDISRLSLQVEQLLHDMNTLIADLKHQASTDDLTGLMNRRALFEHHVSLFERARRDRSMVAVAMFDLDFFKRLNDTYGHEMGDRVLFSVAETVRSNLRPYDLLGRIGGEEFCLIMPVDDPADVAPALERLRLAVSRIEVGPLPKGSVTASFGAAAALPDTAGLAALMRAADAALYESKRNGRNRSTVVVHGTAPRIGASREPAGGTARAQT